MKILKIILAVLLLAIAGVCFLASKMPDDYRYSRSATMNASPDEIFVQVNNLQNWNNWSPWAKLDPNAKMTYEGPNEGNGAIMRWAGNMNVGEGSLTITSNRPGKLVQYQLDFLKPMKGTAKSEMTFEQAPENQTYVTWSMYGTSTFFEKVIGIVMNCEKMMNEQFDEGLANLKAVVEAQS